MKLRNDMRTILAAAASTLLLTACAAQARQVPEAPAPPVNGPAADYPLVIGEPFTIGEITYKPVDTLNYDQVGYAGSDDYGAIGITGSNKILPLPSYVEVTSLDSGRTILLRLERRGPMTNDRLVGLSPAAMHQLGVADGAPVRVRRVNPPEEQRALLRAGEEAPMRMDTPEGLLEVLRKRLPEGGSASLSDPRQSRISGKAPTPEAMASIDPDAAAPAAVSPRKPPVREDKSRTVVTPAPIVKATEASPIPSAAAEEGRFVVQLGTFGVRANAEKLAARVGGHVEMSGKFALVRTGPYASRGQAADALAKAKAQGYSDAQIKTLD